MFYLLHFVLMFTIKFNEISATLSIQFWYKGRYTRYVWRNFYSYFGIAFLLFFIRIEKAVYTFAVAKTAHFCSLMD